MKTFVKALRVLRADVLVRQPARLAGLLVLSLVLTSCGADKPPEVRPHLTLSATRILHKGWIDVKGTGFSPKATVISHLRRPDGTEFPELAMLTDDRGELTHEIDTLLLQPGFHDLWIIDSTGVSSNVAQFEVTLEPPR